MLYRDCTDISLDLETLSTYRNAVIISIGAVGFDMDTGFIHGELEVHIDPQDAMNKGLVTDKGTVDWWLQQSDQAWKYLMVRERTVEEACNAFIDFVREFPKGVRLWGNGVGFDNMLLRDMFDAVGKRFPVHWTKDMDMRTIMMLLKEKTGRRKEDLRVSFSGVKHCALDDARHQAKLISEAWRYIKY